MVNNLTIPNIRLFVYGTLRTGEMLDYFMEGSCPMGMFATKGQLLESANGNAYIDFSKQETYTIGELYHVNYYCLLRINHLEGQWNEFPKGYDLTVKPIWSLNGEELTFDDQKATWALCFKLREATEIKAKDWTKRTNVIEEVRQYLANEVDKKIYYNDLIKHIKEYLK